MEEEEGFTFSKKNLKRNIFVALQNMRRNGEFCDVTLKVQGVSICAHGAILAATIPYFQKRLTSNESKHVELNLVGTDPATVTSFVDFAYTGKIRITPENAFSLLKMSDFFQLDDVSCACAKYLSARLCPSNVLRVRTICLKYNIENLLGKIDRYVIDNFEEISHTTDFLRLTFSYLEKILRRDDLNVTTEEHVYEAVTRWVSAETVERQKQLPKLLLAVRVPRLSPLTRMQLLFGGTIGSRFQQKDAFFRNFVARPRTATVRRQERSSANLVHHGLFAVNNSDSHAHLVCKYDFKNVEWSCVGINNLSNKRDYIYRAVASNEGKIYMFLERKIQVFHLKTRMWTLLKPEHYYIAGSGICFQEDKIYIFGGCFGCSSGKVRCFDPRKEKWLEKGDMKEHRIESGAADLGKFIFVTGGHYKGSVKKSVEMFDPVTRKSSMKVNSLSSIKCRKISPMLNERCGHGCTAMNQKIYVCGGYQSTKWKFLVGNESHPEITNTAEVYDPVTNEWTFISSLHRPRMFLSLVSYDQKLYAAGGMDQDNASVFDVEAYDSQLDKWELCPQFPKYSTKDSYVKLVTTPVYDEYEPQPSQWTSYTSYTFCPAKEE